MFTVKHIRKRVAFFSGMCWGALCAVGFVPMATVSWEYIIIGDLVTWKDASDATSAFLKGYVQRCLIKSSEKADRSETMPWVQRFFSRQPCTHSPYWKQIKACAKTTPATQMHLKWEVSYAILPRNDLIVTALKNVLGA